ncbi:MAG: hypothetical protein PHI79_05205 [Sulfurovaceae bacterium]|nr:hypothetical protein [Sulfurovaceae bacterium]MDD5548979.1 hypothetical protein [Sulfurovaceae bacterium]
MAMYSFELTSGNRTGLLNMRIEADPNISHFNDTVWRCTPDNFLGAAKGTIAWKGMEIGLFSDDALEIPAGAHYPQVKPGYQAYAILEIPEEGLDEVIIGTTGVMRVVDGTWKLTSRK